MKKKDMQNLVEQYYKFAGISSHKKQTRILNLLSYCKEIRDTAYPLKNSSVTELEIVEFTAHKEKDLIYINGSLCLRDGDNKEDRCFEAYIIEDKEDGNIRVYMDIVRINAEDEPKMIRTSEAIIESEQNIITITSYTTTDSNEEKTFSSEFPKNQDDYQILEKKVHQLSAI